MREAFNLTGRRLLEPGWVAYPLHRETFAAHNRHGKLRCSHLVGLEPARSRTTPFGGVLPPQLKIRCFHLRRQITDGRPATDVGGVARVVRAAYGDITSTPLHRSRNAGNHLRRSLVVELTTEETWVTCLSGPSLCWHQQGFPDQLYYHYD